jgi:hypothetical protein
VSSLPFSHSVVKDELAMAEPQPKVCTGRKADRA